MAQQDVKKTKHVAVVSIYPELSLTLRPEKFEYIKLEDGTHKEVRMRQDHVLQFSRFVAFIEESEVEALRNKYRYGTEMITVPDLRELDKSKDTKPTSNGIRHQIFLSSHKSQSPLNSESDVMDLINEADDKAKAM